VLIPGLIEHVERAGVHSGDSIGVYPPQRLTEIDQDLVVESFSRFARASRSEYQLAPALPIGSSQRRQEWAEGYPAD